eukprot:5267274-Pyramimonas_sp.AAC.1
MVWVDLNPAPAPPALPTAHCSLLSASGMPPWRCADREGGADRRRAPTASGRSPPASPGSAKSR